MTSWLEKKMSERKNKANNVEKAVPENKGKVKSITNSDVEKSYKQSPSITDMMSIVDWNDEYNVGLLEDGVSLIRFLEIKDVSSETMSEEAINELYDKLRKLLSSIVPLEDENPWAISIYFQDDMTLKGLQKRQLDYVSPELKDDPFTKHFIGEVMADHYKLMCEEKGIFTDPMSGLPFRGRSRRIRMGICRRHKQAIKGFDPRQDTLLELDEVTENLFEALKDKGLALRKMEGRHVYEWFLRWFNPKPELSNGSVDDLLDMFPYPVPDKKPFGWSMLQNSFKSTPESIDTGWIFDGIEHRVLVFSELENAPIIGAISRERSISGKRYSLMDRLPPGSVYTMQMVFESKQTLERHLDKIEKSAIGKGQEPQRVKSDVNQARDHMNNDNILIRTSQAIFFRGDNDDDLIKKERTIRLMLANSGLRVIETRFNLYPADTYLRFLPGNYDYSFEKHKMFVSQYLYATDIAALLPFYGRSRGDQLNPMFVFFNRGGEGFIFDPYSENFKSNNSHVVLFGTSGAGKSVMLNYMIMSMIAMKNYRVAVLEAGGSFDVLTAYLKHYGKKVHYIKFDRKNPVAVNPYMDAYKIIDSVKKEKLDLIKQAKKVTDEKGVEKELLARHVDEQMKNFENKAATEEEKQANEDRDILNEMALITRCMVTGGDAKEEEAITRADMGLMTKVIIDTVERCYTEGKDQVLAEDISDGFKAEAESDADNARRLKGFALSMSQFLKGELAKFFNRPSEPIPDFDYMHIDLGFLKEQGMESGLNVTAISILSRVLGIAEANQYNDRPFVFVKDEVHLLYKFSIIAAFSTLMAKVSRKLGLWLMPATQNVADLDGTETKKLLSMMETWICLSLSEKEISHIPQFRSITPEQKVLLRSVKKFPKIYAEAVLLGENHQGLFRNIPPRIALALAMTEQNEKAERRKIAEEFGYTDLEAVEHIAEKMKKYRREIKEDAVFDD